MARQNHSLSLPTVARKRQGYETRCGAARRDAKILAKAFSDKPVFVEDEDGHLIRDWSRPHEKLSNDDLRIALLRMRVVEREDMLQYVTPAVIKYAEQQKWIVKDQRAPYYHVTTIAAQHLNLPAKDSMGRRIRFLEA